MTSHPLFKRFDLVLDAPGNIPLLRRFVIHLAVCGRLVEKRDEVLSPADLLTLIASAKKRMMEARKIEAQKPFPPISEFEVPAVYAARCVFERLANVALLRKGLTGIQNARPGEFPLVVTAEARSSSDHYDFDGAAAIIPMVSSSGHGDASLKRIHYQEGKFALGNILCAVFPISPDLIAARFLFEYLRAFKEELIVPKMIGTANVSLTLSKIGEIPVPILSPAVQHRIDEIMALCDQLEHAQAERDHRQNKLVAASLHRLNHAAKTLKPAIFREYARFYINQLPCLATRAVHIKQLRESILDFAVRGLLVPQSTNDEPAPFLLARLAAETRVYASERGIALPKPEPIQDQLLPYHAPKGWVWTRLCSLFKVVTDGDHQPPPKTETGIAFLTIGNITTGHLDFSNCRFVSPAYFESLADYRKPSQGDILYTVVGATYGRPALVNTKRPFCVQRHIAILKPTSEVETKFLFLLLSSSLVYEQATRSTTGAAQPTIPLRPLRNFLVPLPPLAEQRRIVVKVDELMALCDRLEAQLTTVQAESTRLLAAILHHALDDSPPIFANNPSCKPGRPS